MSVAPFIIRSPGDGAYKVSLVGTRATNTTTLLFAGPDDTASVELQPGRYTAIIEPVGSDGLQRQTLRLRPGGHDVLLSDLLSARPVEGLREEGTRSSWTTEQSPVGRRSIVADARPFGIGISCRYLEDAGTRWRYGSIQASSSDVASGGVGIALRRPANWKGRPEWRLTIALEQGRRRRLRLPLFKGGVRIVFTPTPVDDDLTFAVSLTPSDPAKAAIVASLDQMLLRSGVEVLQSSLSATAPATTTPDLMEFVWNKFEDPWAATAAALLICRDPSLWEAQPVVERALAAFPWLTDLHILGAWLRARTATDAASQRALVRRIRKGRTRGKPYFVASVSLAVEMLTACAVGACSKDVRDEALSERKAWATLIGDLQPSGSILSWEERLTTSSRLEPRDYLTLVRGSVTADGRCLDVERATTSSRDVPPAPGMSLPVAFPDDANKGRFGGEAARGGYRLMASFRRGLKSWIELTVEVVAMDNDVPDQPVRLYLHRTFSPDAVQVNMVDGRASYSTLTYGGFTVGAWLSESDIMLELDLSEIDGAPRAIRER
ncbi:pYEATS domain-containing protein [uncultured Sphingomonas sp.]|uniref:pYEATS domain-containing protein n=1 Tax=uncultured Sphingomonas sp. TaxID=158754 RepID=UPI0037479132